jgi:hypothetical protein
VKVGKETFFGSGGNKVGEIFFEERTEIQFTMIGGATPKKSQIFHVSGYGNMRAKKVKGKTVWAFKDEPTLEETVSLLKSNQSN